MSDKRSSGIAQNRLYLMRLGRYGGVVEMRGSNVPVHLTTRRQSTDRTGIRGLRYSLMAPHLLSRCF
jgi:hypothetical protein